jgi:uncharacterized protein YceK
MKYHAPMHGNFLLGARAATLRWLLLGLIICLLQSGCASFSNHMATAPDRTGPPPYADDPEANGNPAKAWYN